MGGGGKWGVINAVHGVMGGGGGGSGHDTVL